MTSNKQHAPSFSEAVESGEVTHKSGYHQPDNYGIYQQACGCTNTTRKGAYRDVTVKLSDGRVIHYYHQSPVVIQDGNTYRIDGFGYLTGQRGGIGSTANRINDRLPYGYKLRREDWVWYLETPDGRVEYESGMVIEV